MRDHLLIRVRPLSSVESLTDNVAELILNGLTTLLGDSVGRVFQSLFPPMPQFKGRQVVTLHNQRDFLFFRRHRLVPIPLHSYSSLPLSHCLPQNLAGTLC
jgi:rRNA maturation protein Rpf1